MKKGISRFVKLSLAILCGVSALDYSKLQISASESKITNISAKGKSTKGHEAALAIDGNMDTFYQTPATPSMQEHYRNIDLTLNGFYKISKIKVFTKDDSYEHYEIYASETGESFDKVAYKDNDVISKEGDVYALEGNVEASVLRINLSFNSRQMEGNLKEIEVYGTKIGDAKPNESKIEVANFTETDWDKELKKQQTDQAYADKKLINEMGSLVERVLGKTNGPKWKNSFVFEKRESLNGKDVYEISNTDDHKIKIRGNNGVAMASGFNHYLKEYCKVDYNPLFSSNLDMPSEVIPVTKKIVKETQYDERYALNFCTYSYTMAFWGWDEYQEFLDWSAMCGINLILDIVGQEEVIRRTLSEYNYSDEEIKDYISGPGYFAWFYMQNMSSFGGPLPDNWFDQRVELGRKMHDRMLTLGMRPVMGGFSGMVPNNFGSKFPDATIVNQSQWCAFQRPDMLRVYVNEGKRDYFKELADVYYKAQRDVFGDVTNYYAVDPFHEGGSTGDMDLTKVYEVVQKQMLQNDPEAIWVLQQWAGGLTAPKLAKLDTEHTLVLDLSSEYDSYYDRMENAEVNWVWNMIASFGGKYGMDGNAKAVAQDVPEIFNDSKYMKGIGYTSESINRIPALYELLMEMVWTKDPVDLTQFGKEYMERRYGGYNDDMLKAWSLMLESAYDVTTNDVSESLLNALPTEVFKSTSSWGHGSISYDTAKLEEAYKLFLDNYDEYKDKEGFRYDFLDLMRQVLQNSSIEYHGLMMEAYNEKDVVKFDTYSQHFLDMLRIMEESASSNENFLTGPWIENSRKLLDDADDWTKDLFEMNSRALITTWASQTPSVKGGLRDYSYRQWSGITEQIYLDRWSIWVDNYRNALTQGKAPKSENWFLHDWEWANRKSDQGDYALTTKVNDKVDLKKLGEDVYSDYSLKALSSNPDEIKDKIGNVALGKAITSNSKDNVNKLSDLVDGNKITGWTASSATWPVEFEIDLKGIADINGIEMALKQIAGGYPLTYKVEVLNSGKWTEVAKHESGIINSKIEVDYKGTGEKVRFTFNSTDSKMIPEFYELMVYGKMSKAQPDLNMINAALGKTVTLSENRGSDTTKPLKNITDGDVKTRWAQNSFDFPTTITVDLEKEEAIESIDLYLEQPGLRFQMKVIVEDDKGNKTVVKDLSKNNEDMPTSYSIPVGKDVRKIHVEFISKSADGALKGAAPALSEVIAWKKVAPKNVSKGKTVTLSEGRGSDSSKPLSYITDDNIDTKWAQNSADFPTTVMVDLEQEEYIDYIEMYMEQPGLRFQMKVTVEDDKGSKTVVKDLSTNAVDMPSMYSFAVDKDVRKIYVEFISKSADGKLSGAAPALSEIKAFSSKAIVDEEEDPNINGINLALNKETVVTDLATNQLIINSKLITDGNLKTVEFIQLPGAAFRPTVYTVDLFGASYVNDVVVHLEKAGLRFKFQILAIDENNKEVMLLDKSTNMGDLAANYKIDINKKIKKVFVRLIERAPGGVAYLASAGLAEIEINGVADNVATKAEITNKTVKDLSVLKDEKIDTGIKFKADDSKELNYKFANKVDISGFRFIGDKRTNITYKLFYRDESGQLVEYVDESKKTTKSGNFVKEFKSVLTDEVIIRWENEEININEIYLYRKNVTQDLKKAINGYREKLGRVEIGLYAGQYKEEARDAFVAVLNEIDGIDVSDKNSEEVKVDVERLATAYRDFLSGSVHINRDDLYIKIDEVASMLATDTCKDMDFLKDAYTSARGAYDTFKITQAELDTATQKLKEVQDKAFGLVSTMEGFNLIIKIAEGKADAAVVGERHGNVSQEALDELKNAIRIAKEAISKAGSDEAVIKSVTETVKGANDKFDKSAVVVDKTKLQALIQETTVLKETQYTKETWANLQGVLASANAINDEKDSLLSDVESIVAKLQDAKTTLVILNRESLQLAIQESNTLKQESFTKETWDALQKVLDNARTIVIKDSLSQKEVDDITTSLDATKKALVILDRANLEALLASIQGLNAAEYTEASWATMILVNNEASNLLKSVSLSQREVDAMEMKLQKAKNDLVKPDKDKPKPETPVVPDNKENPKNNGAGVNAGGNQNFNSPIINRGVTKVEEPEKALVQDNKNNVAKNKKQVIAKNDNKTTVDNEKTPLAKANTGIDTTPYIIGGVVIALGALLAFIKLKGKKKNI